MDLTRITSFGRDVRTRLRTFFDTPLDRGATPLEVAQAVLDDVEARVEPVGRGARAFPFTSLHVRVLAPGDAAACVEACFHGFDARVRERLAELRCEAPASLDVQLTCLDGAPETWPDDRVFDVTYTRQPPVSPEPVPAADAEPMAPRPLTLTVVRGAASAECYTFTEGTVSIGRSADPTDASGRVRRNRVAFADAVDGVTETVGRAHARLRFDPVRGEYRLYDDGSSNGTAIVRDGDVIVVARRDPRGVRVRSGDEIQVGRAVLRLEIG